jgi:hypothetical protein
MQLALTDEGENDMRKTQTTKQMSERGGLRIIAAIALSGSLAAFGCSTNKMPGNGEPAMSAPAAGSVAPNATSTPGSSSGTSTPQAMISSSPAPAGGFSASEDAVAVMKADEAYRGKVLGEAAPGDNSIPSQSMQQATGQYVSPSLAANPQLTLNSSISSAPAPVTGIPDAEILAVPFASPGVATTGTTASGNVAVPTAGAAPMAIANGVANVGTTGVSNATATAITNSSAASTAAASPLANGSNTASSTNNQMISTGMASAPAAGSNAVATPILATAGPSTGSAVSTTGSASVLGVSNVTAGTASAMPTVRRPATVRSATAGMRLTTNQTAATTATSASTTNTASGVRVETAPSGTVVLTNTPPSTFQRFLSAIGFRRRAVTAGTTTSTTTPNQ